VPTALLINVGRPLILSRISPGTRNQEYGTRRHGGGRRRESGEAAHIDGISQGLEVLQPCIEQVQSLADGTGQLPEVSVGRVLDVRCRLIVPVDDAERELFKSKKAQDTSKAAVQGC